MLYLTFVCFSSTDAVLGVLLLLNNFSGEIRVKNCNTDDFFFFKIYNIKLLTYKELASMC